LSFFATISIVCVQFFEQYFAATDKHKVCIASQPEYWKQSKLKLPHDDLIWQVPTFHNNGVAINQSAIKDRILFLRTRGNQSKTITSYVWDIEQVQDWAHGAEPSVLLVVGTSQQRKTLDTFGIEVVDNVKSPDVVLYLLSPLPDEVADLTTNRMDDILRQLAIQALQTSHPMTTLINLRLLIKLMQLVTSGDWFQALAGILSLKSCVKGDFIIIVDTGVLRNNFHDADLLPDVFLKLIRQLKGKIKLRVMVIFGRRIVLDLDPAIKTFSVDRRSNRLPPRATHSTVYLGGPMTPFEGIAGSPATASNEIATHSIVASASTSERAIYTVTPNECIGSGRPEESGSKSTTTINSDTKAEGKDTDSISLGAFQASTTDSRWVISFAEFWRFWSNKS
jgi:hypothetical protein